jgi:hypothetical protein
VREFLQAAAGRAHPTTRTPTRIRDDTPDLPHTEACGRPRHPDDPRIASQPFRAHPLRSRSPTRRYTVDCEEPLNPPGVPSAAARSPASTCRTSDLLRSKARLSLAPLSPTCRLVGSLDGGRRPPVPARQPRAGVSSSPRASRHSSTSTRFSCANRRFQRSSSRNSGDSTTRRRRSKVRPLRASAQSAGLVDTPVRPNWNSPILRPTSRSPPPPPGRERAGRLNELVRFFQRRLSAMSRNTAVRSTATPKMCGLTST